MKKNITTGVLLAALLISCNEPPKKAKILQPILKNDSLNIKDSLIGKWGALNGKSPVWDIRKDSIYYFERSTAYPYKIINCDFVIYFTDHSAALRNIKVVRDTMFFLDENGQTVKGYRFKK